MESNGAKCTCEDGQNLEKAQNAGRDCSKNSNGNFTLIAALLIKPNQAFRRASRSGTLFDLADEKLAHYELNDHDDDHRDRVIGKIQKLIASKGVLDSRERKALRLRYEQALDIDAVAERIGMSTPMAKRAIRSAVKKLRAHFADQGYDVLPQDMPIPKDGNHSGCPAEVRS